MNSNFINIIKHGGNYLIASLATSALSFVSIPIYTRILSPLDYGIVSIYTGFVGVLATIIAFSADRSVSRYFFDQKDEIDFKKFVGTSSVLSIIFFLVNSILIFIFSDKLSSVLNLNVHIIYLMIPMSFINIVGLLFEQIYGPLKKSREIAFSSFAKVFLGFIFSIIFISLFINEKFYGHIIGQIISGGIILLIWIRLIRPYFLWSFDKSYIKYIFNFSIPLIPYALSGVIIEQFGKISIGSSLGMSEAGFYSLALTISSIVNIAISVTHQAWSPYYFEYMNSKEYDQLDNDFVNILKFTIITAFGVACFGNEIGLLLAKKEFTGALHLIPIFSMGYIFSQLSFAYIRNFSYTKKTHFMTITILFCGFCNVVFNIYFIPYFGTLGAAYSFLLSYIIMYLFAFYVNYKFVKLHATPFKKLLFPILITVLFYIILYYVIKADFKILSAFCRGGLFFFLFGLFFWKYKSLMTDYVKKHLIV
jgi:O-antigen/teichoic acid export membrane protein